MWRILALSLLSLLFGVPSVISPARPLFPTSFLVEQSPTLLSVAHEFALPPRPGVPSSLAHPRSPSLYSSWRLLNLARQSTPPTPERVPPQMEPVVQRLLEYLLLQESLARWHYHWGTQALPQQRSLSQLQHYFLQSYWFRENLQEMLIQREYGFPELSLVRVLSAIQASSYFLEIPYPTLFCLFFKESRLDYKAVSPTGARGLGQLTGIGIQQIEQIRRQAGEDERLQATLAHLQRRYADPTWQGLLQELGFEGTLPQDLSLPSRMEVPTRYASLRLPEVQQRLLAQQLPYASNTMFVQRQLRRMRQGRRLPLEYAPIHAQYVEVLQESYASEPGNIFHIETNVLLSSALFRHYLNYEWRFRGNTWDLQPAVRRALAVAAYNQGQTGVRRLLYILRRELRKEPNEITLADLLRNLTLKRVQRALEGSEAQSRELRDHVLQIAECAEAPMVLPPSARR